MTAGTLVDQGVHIVLTDTTMLEFKVSDKSSWGEARSSPLKELLKDHKQDVARRTINSSYCRSAMGEPLLPLGKVSMCVGVVWSRLNPHSLKKFKVRIE